MAQQNLISMSVQEEIDYFVKREKEERRAARIAADTCARDSHAMLAERFAERAHELAENRDGPALPSGLWDRKSRQPEREYRV